METNENKPTSSPGSPPAAGHVVIIGAGNTGSALVGMMSRSEFVKRLTLVDHDVYDVSNLRGQAIRSGDVGQPKVFVQAERARQINPNLQVEAIFAAVENVPLGRLRADVMLGCLDSKLARQGVNQRAWRLGVPWVDAGVAAGELLARVNVYLPGDAQPCYECAWSARDYETLEVKRPCQADGGVAPTRAPAFLGSLAAALQAIECHKILAGDWKSALVGKQVTFVGTSQESQTMSFRRNPKCLFDHRTFRIEPFRIEPAAWTLQQFMAGCRAAIGGAAGIQLQHESQPFERQWRCACGAEKAVLKLAGRSAVAERRCNRCGETMAAVGFVTLPSLCEGSLTPQELALPLAALGLAAGDVFRARSTSGQTVFELVTP